jgi:secreted Zn-dependent insulinase-like peptidase
MAYFAISVNAGSFNDPPERPGLAHFLEHMIFIGSEKYPGEAEFSDHISANGGVSNAYTCNEYTNYHFSVNFNGLKKALDLKANLMAKPLMKKDAITREIEAVESEFRSTYTDDESRAV